jgi:hypothetical protein
MEVTRMLKKSLSKLMVLFVSLVALQNPLTAAPKWIEKQGKGVFLFNVAIVFVIIGVAGWIMWKKKNGGDDGGDE